MTNAEVFDNLELAVDILIHLIPEGLDSIVREKDTESERSLLFEKAGNLSYTKLDKYYNKGFSAFHNEHMSECETLLVCGVGLLTEYGLDEDELIEWADAQDTPFKDLVYPLVGKEISDEAFDRIQDEFEQIVYSNIFNNRDLSLEPRYGIEFAREKADTTNKQFSFLGDYIIYHDEFDRYQSSINKLKEIFGNAFNNFWSGSVEPILKEVGSCDAHFYDTLIALFDAYLETHETVLRTLTTTFRKSKSQPSDIQSFRNKFHEISGEYQVIFINILTPFVNTYEGLYPENNRYSHNYLNYVAAIDEARRSVGVAGLNLTAVQKEVAFTANKAATDIGKCLVGAVIDSMLDIASQSAFSRKMRAAFLSDGFHEAMQELFIAFESEITPSCFIVLRTPNFGLLDYAMADGTANVLRESFLNSKSTGNNGLSLVLKSAAMDEPYDPDIYNIAYLCYGDNAGELDEITEYLGISSKYHDGLVTEFGFLKQSIENDVAVWKDDSKKRKDLLKTLDWLKSYSVSHKLWTEGLNLLVGLINAVFAVERYNSSHDTTIDGNNGSYYSFLHGTEKFNSKNGPLWKKLYDRTNKAFHEQYPKMALVIDQSIYGPIGLIYDDILAFTPEKLIYLQNGIIEGAYDYYDLELQNSTSLGSGYLPNDIIQVTYKLGDNLIPFDVTVANRDSFGDAINWLRTKTAKRRLTDFFNGLRKSGPSFHETVDSFSAISELYKLWYHYPNHFPEIEDAEIFQLLNKLAKEAGAVDKMGVVNKTDETAERTQSRVLLIPILAYFRLKAAYGGNFKNALIYATHQQLMDRFNSFITAMRDYGLFVEENGTIGINPEYDLALDSITSPGYEIKRLWKVLPYYPACWEGEVFRQCFPNENPFGKNVFYAGEELACWYHNNNAMNNSALFDYLEKNEKYMLFYNPSFQKDNGFEKFQRHGIVLTNERIIWRNSSDSYHFSLYDIEDIQLKKRILSTIIIINRQFELEPNLSAFDNPELFVDCLNRYIHALKSDKRRGTKTDPVWADTLPSKEDIQRGKRVFVYEEICPSDENEQSEETQTNVDADASIISGFAESVEENKEERTIKITANLQDNKIESEEEKKQRLIDLYTEAKAIWKLNDSNAEKFYRSYAIAKEAGILDKDGLVNKSNETEEQTALRLMLLPVIATYKISSVFNSKYLWGALVYNSHQQLIENYNQCISIIKEFDLYGNETDDSIELNSEYDEWFQKEQQHAYWLNKLFIFLNHYPMYKEGEIFRKVFSDAKPFGENVTYAGEEIKPALLSNLLDHFLKPNERFMLFVNQQENLQKGLVLTDKRIIWSGVNGTEAIPFTDIKGISTKKRLLSSNILINGQTEISLFGMQNQNLFIKLLCEYIIALRKESENPTTHPKSSSSTKSGATVPPEQTEKQQKGENPDIAGNHTPGEATQNNRDEFIPLSALSDAEVSPIVLAIMQRFDVDKCFAVGTQEYQAKITKAMNAYASFTKAERPILLNVNKLS